MLESIRLEVKIAIILFIVCIMIIVLSEESSSAFMTISLMASFLIIFYHVRTLYKSEQNDETKMNFIDPATTNEPTKPVETDPSSQDWIKDTKYYEDEASQISSMYGTEFDKYMAMKNETADPIFKFYADVGTPSEQTASVDAQNMKFARSRARDKRSMTAHVRKNANFYKYHFGDELKDEENKPWWSRDE